MRRQASAAGLLLFLAACADRSTDVTLLFFRRSPVAQIGTTTWAPDVPASRIIVFHGARPLRALTGAATTPVAATTLGRNILVSELTGEGVVLDTTGLLVREFASPHPVALYASRGDRIVAVRSPYRVPAFLTEPDSAPLIRVLDTLGRPLEGLATVQGPLVTAIANAGAVAASERATYFAPMIEDQIRKYDAGGRLVWTATRGLPPRRHDQPTRPPLVNVALTLGPDGRLYALGASDSSAERLRVDVVDTASGQIVATHHLEPRQTAIGLGPDGSIVTFDADSLAALIGAEGREPFAPAVTLPDLQGDSVRFPDDYQGHVRLLNFWASWCDPCREEFPHMGELAREFQDRRFVIVAISDDVDRRAMRAFLERYDPGNLVILAGGGRMKARYHYRGLPYSVLIDREGRVIERIFGFGGEREFARLRQTIANALSEP